MTGDIGRDTFGEIAAGRNWLVSWHRTDGLGSITTTDETATRIVHGPMAIRSEAELRSDSLVARSDEFGYGAIFVWEGDGVAAMSTRPELLVQVAALTGSSLAREPRLARELSTIGFLAPDVCGWQGIRPLTVGESVVLRDGRAEIRRDETVAAWTDEPGAVRPIGDVVAEAAEALIRSVTAALELGQPVFADLTSGRDTRTILAALIAMDAVGDVTFQTVGEPDLHDVRVARAIAETLDLRHRDGFFYPLPEGDLTERIDRHLPLCAGMVNIKDGIRTVPPGPPMAQIRLSGIVAEVFRGWGASIDRERTAGELVREIVTRLGGSRLELLRPDAAEEALAETDAAVLRDGGADAPAWLILRRYYTEARLRSPMCRNDDFQPDVRICPFYTPEIVRLGLEAAWHHPEHELTPLMLERLAPGLDARLRAAIDATIEPAVDPTSQPASLMSGALARQATERRAILEHLSNLDSAAWDIVDPIAYAQAVSRYDHLDNLELGLLHGAAGAVLWLRG